MTSILQRFLTESPFLAIFVVFWVGAIASLGSCTLVRMPIQPVGARGIKGTVDVQAEYEDGLKDLDGFSHIILIYHFHLAGLLPAGQAIPG